METVPHGLCWKMYENKNIYMHQKWTTWKNTTWYTMRHQVAGTVI